jgi:hypothetical protein
MSKLTEFFGKAETAERRVKETRKPYPKKIFRNLKGEKELAAFPASFKLLVPTEPITTFMEETNTLIEAVDLFRTADPNTSKNVAKLCGNWQIQKKFRE